MPDRSARALAAAAVALALVAAACSADTSDDAAPREGSAVSSDTSGPTTTEAPPPAGTPAELLDHAADWPTAGQDLLNKRAVAASNITADNVDQLEETWRAGLDGLVPLVQSAADRLESGPGAVGAGVEP